MFYLLNYYFVLSISKLDLACQVKAVLAYSLQYTTLLFKYNRLQTDIYSYKRLKYECPFFGGASLHCQTKTGIG
jgi:hypothetical protein